MTPPCSALQILELPVFLYLHGSRPGAAGVSYIRLRGGMEGGVSVPLVSGILFAEHPLIQIWDGDKGN